MEKKMINFNDINSTTVHNKIIFSQITGELTISILIETLSENIKLFLCYENEECFTRDLLKLNQTIN